MKIKKQLIAILTLAIIAFISLSAAEFNLKYMIAEVIYGDKNSVESEILFSKKAGFYEEEFYLSIYAPSDEIYYTLDGSEPTKESMKYEGAILVSDASRNENTNSMRTDVCGSFLTDETLYQVPDYLVDKCTIIKAAYYDKEGNRSESEERAYIVDFEEKSGDDNINIISITTEPENLFGEEQGIYVLGNTFKEFAENNDLSASNYYRWGANYLNRGKEWEREAYIQVFDEEKTLVLSQSVGIRIQGGVSRGLLPKSLNIYARTEYGNNRMQYDFFDTGYYPQRVTLSSGGNDYYGKMLDRLGAELVEECDFCTMNFEPYALFLNGEYWGFYYLTEKYDEHYIEEYYDVNQENVIIIKNGNLEVGTEEDKEAYEQMKNFVEYADMTVEQNYQMACTLLDMQSFIDYFAAEIYMARQVDWPSANYALWRSRDVSDKLYEDGKWRWMLFDVNTAAMVDDFIDHDTLAYVIQESRMFANLSTNAGFRESFSKRILEMADTIFAPEIVEEKLAEYEKLMAEPMEKNHQRFFGTSNDSFYYRIKIMKKFANERKDYVVMMLENNSFV